MLVVNQANELLEDLRDVMGLGLEEGAVPDAYLHILELDSRVVKRRNSFCGY